MTDHGVPARKQLAGEVALRRLSWVASAGGGLALSCCSLSAWHTTGWAL